MSLLKWLLGGLGAAFVLHKTTRVRAGATLPTPTVPDIPPQTPVGPLLTANVPGFRRARSAEIPPEILSQARAHLVHPIGSVHVQTDSQGRRWAFALEEHFRDPNSSEPGPKGRHKGVSIFVHKEDLPA